MKAFHFTLEAVGTLRRLQEQKGLEHYARCLAARLQAVEATAAVERELSACWQEWRGQLAGGFAAADAAKVQAYQRLLAQRRDECIRAVEAAERRVNAALQAMLLATSPCPCPPTPSARMTTAPRFRHSSGESGFQKSRQSSLLARTGPTDDKPA